MFLLLICELASPEAPQEAKISSFDRASVNLTWKPPKSDGGSPVIGYNVEKRVAAKGAAAQQAWVKVNPKPVESNKFTAINLEEGIPYEFRVVPANLAGTGTPSKPIGPHVVRAPVCKNSLFIF